MTPRACSVCQTVTMNAELIAVVGNPMPQAFCPEHAPAARAAAPSVTSMFATLIGGPKLAPAPVAVVEELAPVVTPEPAPVADDPMVIVDGPCAQWPVLVGSEKQVAWARDIRSMAFAKFGHGEGRTLVEKWLDAALRKPATSSRRARLFREAISQTSAAWWIDHRKDAEAGPAALMTTLVNAELDQLAAAK